jgi:hypothetical protein
MAKQMTALEEPLPSPSELLVPTHHAPGSAAKVAVLAERVERNLPLWHPDDAKLADYRRVAG